MSINKMLAFVLVLTLFIPFSLALEINTAGNKYEAGEGVNINNDALVSNASYSNQTDYWGSYYYTLFDDYPDWNTAFGWGDHGTEGYLTGDGTENVTFYNATILDNLTIGDRLAVGGIETSKNIIIPNAKSLYTGNVKISDSLYMDYGVSSSYRWQNVQGILMLNTSPLAGIWSTSVKVYKGGAWEFQGYPYAKLGYCIGELGGGGVECISSWADVNNTYNDSALNFSEWNEAYSWGDHALEGYLVGDGTENVRFNRLNTSWFGSDFGGGMDMTGDPWYLSGTDLQLAEDLIIDKDINLVGNIDGKGNSSSFNQTLLIQSTNFENATLVIDSDMNQYSCIDLTEGDGAFGFKICYDGAGTNRFVINNYDDGYEYMWIDRDNNIIHFNNVTEISGNLSVSQNISADTYFGDGSLLTGVSASLLWDGSGWIYNDTTTQYFNETKHNETTNALIDDNGFVKSDGTVPMTDTLEFSGTTSSTYVGKDAGLGDDYSTNRYNSAFGEEALKSASTGDNYNNAFGFWALRANTGHNNNAFGYAALYRVTDGFSNTGIGHVALAALTTGDLNVAIGDNAGAGISTGNYNVAIGGRTLSSTGNTALYNTAIGQEAMRYITSGGSNLGLGALALTLVTTGTGNVGIGARAGQKLNTSDNNVMIGSDSAPDLINGTFNTIIGSFSGGGLTNGSYNTLIGANIDGLNPYVNKSIVLADGQGNIQLQFDGIDTWHSASNFIINGTTILNDLFRVNGVSEFNGTINQSSGNAFINNIYGELWNFSEAGVTHTILGADTYINITTGTQCGEINGFTCSNGVLTALFGGRYKASYGMSFNGGNADEYHPGVGIFGISYDRCHAVRDAGTASKTGAVARSCLINVTAGDEITFMVENDADADDVVIEDFNLNLVRIGYL